MLDKILEKLEKVKKIGHSYRACCPVHQDRSPSMTITQKDDRILMHCFSCGAKGLDVVNAIGLPASVLFQDEWQRPQGLTPKQKEQLLQDRFVLAMEEQAKTYEDFKRVRLARERSKYLESLHDSLSQ